MRLQDSLEFALLKGKNKKQVKEKISARIWPKSLPKTREVNVSNLFRGDTKSYTEEVIKIICEETGTDADFLFDIKPMKRINESL